VLISFIAPFLFRKHPRFWIRFFFVLEARKTREKLKIFEHVAFFFIIATATGRLDTGTKREAQRVNRASLLLFFHLYRQYGKIIHLYKSLL
jgi:hypothetical protein